MADYVSNSCPEKSAFLEAVSEAAIYEEVDVEVPEGAFSFDIEGDVAVPKRSRDSDPLLVNGEPIDDDPTNDVPLKLVREGGTWRIENCSAYVP